MSTPNRNTPNRNTEISAAILAAIAKGADTREAVDSVLGEGAYERLASDLYDALRAKVAR